MKSSKQKSRTPAAKSPSEALTKRTGTTGADTAYRAIAEILQTARATAYRAVNEVMVQAYWQVGRVIVEEEQRGKKRADYGRALIEELAPRLTANFGKGFDKSNLWHMRKFYLTFLDFLDAVRRELSWTHYRLLLRIEKDEARSFYEIEGADSHWSTRELERQIGSLLYERLALSRDKKKVLELAAEGQIVREAEDLIKDPYVLEFLNVKENQALLEKDLEQVLIDRLQAFLLELAINAQLAAGEVLFGRLRNLCRSSSRWLTRCRKPSCCWRRKTIRRGPKRLQPIHRRQYETSNSGITSLPHPLSVGPGGVRTDWSGSS